MAACCAIFEAAQAAITFSCASFPTCYGKDYAALAEVGALFDLIAVQEVMSQEGVDRFQSALEARTGAAWDQLCSHLIGRGSYQEMYCFVWRSDRVSWVDGAVVYLDDRDLFAREPFSAVFETRDRIRFIATSVHAIYGEDVAEREAEARALRGYHDWLSASFPQVPILLMGDFNLPPTNAAWAPMGEVAYPLIREGATTLSTIEGRFANLYDNIWVDTDADLPVSGFGLVAFPHDVLGISHETARDRVSDHVPVYVELSVDASVRFAPNNFEGARRAAPSASPSRPLPTPEPESAGSVAEPVIGNARSKVYHLPHCPSYDAVGAQNRRPFGTEAEAVSAGYRRAGNC
jgi:hypothetical protein